MNFDRVVEELARRLTRIFVRDLEGKRAVFRDCKFFDRMPIGGI